MKKSNNTRVKQIKGDASFRKFFRKKDKDHSSIVVFAKKEKLKNLLIYDAINKILHKNKILAPNLYQESYSKNFIEIQDFGNKTIFSELNKIQSIKSRRIKNFKEKMYLIPKYDENILIREANLFCEWYTKKKLTRSNQNIFSKKFKKIIKRLVANLRLKNNVFVHRDFHVSNLMLVNNQIGLIDSQDALIGNKAYDLASLIDDVRLKTSKLLKKKIYNNYINSQKRLNKYKFKNDFEILSILRNLKIIGIFTRLSIRDNKKNYLRLIPHAWELINLRINENKIFYDLKYLLTQNFNKKIR